MGREKEGDLATTSLEFDYLHRKKRCEMLFSGDDTSNGVITLGTYFSMFVYIRARFRFALIGGNLTVDGEPQGNWRRNSNSRNVVASSLSFSPPPERPGELARRLEARKKTILVIAVTEAPDAGLSSKGEGMRDQYPPPLSRPFLMN